jgi:hypothetical protein
MPLGKYPYMKNVRSYRDGVIEGRQGLTAINSVATSPDADIHSYARINDYVNVNFARFLGIGTSLYYGTNSFTAIDSGYSGVPLSIIPYRPSQSPRVWAYIGDFNKMQKVNTSGTHRAVGIAPPNVIPIVELSDPAYGASSVFDTNSGWTNQGTAGAITVGARLTGVTINNIVYISGTTGWCMITPTGGNNSDIIAGMQLQINQGGGNFENVIVEEVHKTYTLAGNTIAAIDYDSGTTGLCTIQPVSPLSGLARNAWINLNGSGNFEDVRIISVTNGPGGLTSLRAKTVQAHVAGEAVVPPFEGSFWTHTVNTHVPGETLKEPFLTSSITTGIGTLAYNGGLPGLNLGSVQALGVARPLGPDDYIHIAVQIDKPELLVEGKLSLDIDAGTTATFNAADCTKNFYYKSFRPNDLQGIVKETISTDASRAAALTLQQQDKASLDFATRQNPGAVYGSGSASTPYDQSPERASDALINSQSGFAAQITSGALQWTEFRWKMADLTRIGADQNVDLSAVRGLQLTFVTTGTVVVGIAHLWVGGSYGPDTNIDLTPYLYRYRYRASESGARSLPGPATRTGITSFRQAVLVTTTPSTDPQVDKIDIERLGGTNLEWHYVGTVLNGAGAFFDDQFNAAVVVNAALETDTHQPFSISDSPRSSVVNVAGTTVNWVSGDIFNLQWARGTEITINGKVTTLSATPPTTHKFYITDSLGAQTNAVLEIREPILTGQPLPYVWGPYYETLFACGNILDVGSVYFTKSSDPDSSSDANYIEVVSPSETMMNGCMYDGRAFAFSNKRMFSILPRFITQSGVKSGGYQFVEIPNGKGLFDPWAFCVGPKIYFLSSDGIYETDGGIPVCITNDIRPIFPQGDKPGVSVNGINPIKLQNPGFGLQGPFLRLAYYNGYLFFDYLDCNSNPHTLVYDTERKAWYFDTYFEGTSEKVRFHYTEVAIENNDDVYRLITATSAGFVYTSDGCKDGTIAIQGTIRTPALDVGDTRANKVFGDIVFDMNTNGLDVTVTPYVNSYTTALPSHIYNTIARGITPPIDLLLGSGQLARNLGVELSWTTSI